ncbi:TetR family transcriptional regulator [Corynebacterium sp. SA-MJD20WY100]|uniref:TetR family transcriptional regulator n=1 Tax=Corynebacterium sp. SA-MJD20WY100 TaxID=3142969 RepID=UPI0032214482
MQEELTLREQKRLATRDAIEDAATKLVDGRGFNDVTVEEICEAAGISRRTFFNYFDSKDAAVLGGPSKEFTEDVRQRFLTEPTDNVLTLALHVVEAHMVGHHRDTVVAERRQRIATQPEAAMASMMRKREKVHELMRLIEQRLTAEPELQRLPDSSPATEAMVIASFLREALWLALAGPDIDCTEALADRLHGALHLFTDYAKGIQW